MPDQKSPLPDHPRPARPPPCTCSSADLAAACRSSRRTCARSPTSRSCPAFEVEDRERQYACHKVDVTFSGPPADIAALVAQMTAAVEQAGRSEEG